MGQAWNLDEFHFAYKVILGEYFRKRSSSIHERLTILKLLVNTDMGPIVMIWLSVYLGTIRAPVSKLKF